MQSLTRHTKIGLFGGTFDPVHNGHLAVVGFVREVLELNSIWFIPAAKPPHKPGHCDKQEISDFSHRFAMLKKAVVSENSFRVSDIEAHRSAPSYSIDTIKIIQQTTAEQSDFSFIIGADAFLEINTWKNYRQLPDYVDFIIIPRPGSTPEKVRRAIKQNFPGFTPEPSANRWFSPDTRGKFILLVMEPVPISSTEIRQRVRNGEDISAMVPPAVATYIREHKLYDR